MRVSVGDVALHFDVDGSALAPDGDRMRERPTLLLLHGGPGADHSLFKPETSALTDVAQLVYLDQRGSGRSDAGEPSDWTWTRWADDVAALCQALDITRPVLVGSSSGALVAAVCAARHPELVAGLVLDSALGLPGSLEETLDVFERRGGPVAREAARRYLGGDRSDESTAAWREHCLPLYGAAGAGSDLAPRIARARMNNEVQLHFQGGGCGPAEIAPYGADITCPVLVLAGEHDPVSPAAGAQRLPGSLPNADIAVHVLPGVGHSVLRQAPREATALIRGFLKGLDMAA
ncbi:alpha/beta fold hydrolase [Catellatospora paridis]|uniref:alpha/beta fold hydrolase n=1 Tax=Catellatospora paridis TaxID=1617086 RepID=UPI0012D4151A|nr:alpha/beta hydrolase [Catellatospora paridis]